MKKLILAALILASSPVLADEYVHGYYRQNGTYVEPHYQTPPNGNPYDNYSTRGNSNPYTGQPGYVNPQPVQPQQYQGYPAYR